jgi:ornithine cyclodeaminase/alanine dehydrogenase-like protein (mu-crystallin family)
MRVLTEDDVRRALDPAMLISGLGYAFGTLADHAIRMPPRTRIELAKGTVVLSMPCYDESHGAGLKLVSISKDGGIQATYLLLDPNTGAVEVVIPANELTDLRTAAVSALATDQLARSDARVLGIIGTGRQARAHIRMLPHVRNFDVILVCGSSPARSCGLAQELLRAGLHAEAVGAEFLAGAADVICTCTSSTTPVLRGDWIRAGTHINAVGAYGPQSRELDTAAVQNARLVVDTYEGALAEAGDLLIPIAEGALTRDHIAADLHEVISCKKNGRTADDEITLFKSLGCALEDLAAAQLLVASMESEDSAT